MSTVPSLSSDRFLFLFTCEHATNRIPSPYRSLFRDARQILSTHRGWDAGAAPVAKRLARACQSPLIEGTHSRLLADLNRTEDHENVFSIWTRPLGREVHEKILTDHHRPHWSRVEAEVERGLRRARASGRLLVHVGVHSFTPVFHGTRRRTEIGLLSDPARSRETAFVLEWQKQLQHNTTWTVHRNRPYRGTGNGLINDLRSRHPARDYIGVELELNQKLVGTSRAQQIMAQLLLKTLPR